MRILNKIKPHLDIWSVLSFLFIALIVIPGFHIFINLFLPANENWQHIKDYLLKDYILNSLKLVLFTSIFTVLIGTSLSCLISVYSFPLRDFFKWAFVLPLAIPPNIAAYTYSGLISYTGIVQVSLRNYFNIQANPKYFDIMNIEGATFIFTLFLFPYVYTITRSFLEKQSASLIESARLLGRKPIEIFFTVILPCLRGAIIGSVSLVVLEVLNDFGVVQYFGIQTFSTAIFKTWFAMGDVNSAIKLSSSLMFIVLTILILERVLRGRKKYSYTSAKVRPISPQPLTGINKILAFGYCMLIFSFSFLIPTLQLLYWSFLTYKSTLNNSFWLLIINSLTVALITTLSVVIISVIIANYCRINDHVLSKIYAKITVVGYSVPGAVIAIGILAWFIFLDNQLYGIYKMVNSNSAKLVLSTSILMLIFSYVVRFLAMGFNSIQSGFEKIGNKFFEASRTLGVNKTETFFRVDLPMIKPAVLTSCVLVFVEVIKELPLTLLLRPFNFDTLTTKVFQYASDEMIQEAAIPSMIIIVISLISIYFINGVESKEDN
ncbi:ABC transporter permease [Desulforamulus hydrothermalis]|uniref:Binding-protein-dependent transport systems inner membrane component n=1 Tax=Desulforamulus hydrothermalis Lam5 = DSM 18033 TaxID=1121428 RepID=K8E9B8_9FIRM|nr:iron ABC transporter permease [Desulforamulus hydrothermalis]CCO08143.1 Binding-protein-dependent transport systems inner membrane component [Desulforamulus hydrothermalis Lam5 = DSM 18033]SHH48297.1 iron(III) transport system permease protein [Desulforamulus hydrothermalis Lam5 = DSM 18033]